MSQIHFWNTVADTTELQLCCVKAESDHNLGLGAVVAPECNQLTQCREHVNAYPHCAATACRFLVILAPVGSSTSAVHIYCPSMWRLLYFWI